MTARPETGWIESVAAVAVNQLLIVAPLSPPTVTDTSAAHQTGGCVCECIVTGFHPALQLMPLKLHPVTFVCKSCSNIAYCTDTPYHIALVQSHRWT